MWLMRAMTYEWTECPQPILPPGAIVPMQQHPLYGATCTALGGGIRRYVLANGNGAVLAFAQVLERPVPLLGAAALLSRGPIWLPGTPNAARRSGLMALLRLLRRDHRIVVTTPEPFGEGDPLSGSGWLTAVTACHLARLDLSSGEMAMRARQHGKWRNRLVRAESAGLVVKDTPMPANPGHWLLMKEAEQACNRRYRRLPPAFTAAWVQEGGERSARLFTATKDGAPVAAMLFLLHGNSATYHVGWSGPDGRRAGAHNLLLWRAQLWLAKRGIRLLDLDLIDTHTTPGLARFKLGSGAEVIRLGATRVSAPGSALFAGRTARPRYQGSEAVGFEVHS